MDQTFINAAIGAVGVLVMFIININWQGLRGVQKDIAELNTSTKNDIVELNASTKNDIIDQNAKIAALQLVVAGEYVKKSEFNKVLELIEKQNDKQSDMLEKIYAKLDTKADK